MKPLQSANDSNADKVQTRGLYRTTIAGPGRSLAEAFANLEQSPHVERVLRHLKRDLLSARVELTPDEGEGYWELSRIRNDLYLIISNFKCKEPCFETVPGDGLIQFNFKVSGDLNYGVSCPGPLRFNRPSLHIWRQPRGIDMREWVEPNAHERMVSISVSHELLSEHFMDSSREIPARLESFIAPPGRRIDYCRVPLTARMMEITAQLIDNPYQGNLYLMNAEALTLQLLCTAVANLSLDVQPTERYTEHELAALSAAHRRLMEELSPAPTIRKIARSVGLAENVLTRGFKAIYGVTIFDFSLRCRMQHAMTLLCNKGWSVDRASETTGYAHATSFTAAFRKHFGMRPIDAKRLKFRSEFGDQIHAAPVGTPRKSWRPA